MNNKEENTIRSMDTAPRDGNPILAWFSDIPNHPEDGNYFIIRWDKTRGGWITNEKLMLTSDSIPEGWSPLPRPTKD